MTFRRLFWLAYAACVGLAVFWGVRLLTPRHRISRENYEKIQVGMTPQGLEALLGVPPGDYSTRPCFSIENDGGWRDWSARQITWTSNEGSIGVRLNTANDGGWRDWSARQITWTSNEGSIGVSLNTANKVAGHFWVEHYPIEEEIIDKVRGWFGDNKKPNDIRQFIFFSGVFRGKIDWDKSPFRGKIDWDKSP